jgi:Transposase IS200 like
VLEGALRERIRTIIQQVCKELNVQIISGVMSREHVHMFVEIPPHIAVSGFVRRFKGRSLHRVQMQFPGLRKRTWGQHFWARVRPSKRRADRLSGKATTPQHKPYRKCPLAANPGFVHPA